MIQIRLATEEDLLQIHEIDEQYDGEVFSDEDLKSYIKDTKTDVTFLVAVERRVVGYAITKVDPSSTEDHPVQYLLALVSGRNTKQRIGLKLLYALKAKFPKTGCRLHVEASNRSCIRRYKKCGFRIMREIKDFFGERCHAVEMYLPSI